MRQRNLLFVYASSEKNLREKKEPSLLERTSFLSDLASTAITRETRKACFS